MGMYNVAEYKNWKPGQKVKPKTVTGPGLTKQEFASEVDVNKIMDRYVKTGQLPQSYTEGVFADVSEIGDFANVMNRVHAADEAFALLPSKVRERFEGDPVKLIGFLADEKNRDEAVKLGLIAKKEEPAPPQPPALPAEKPKA